MTYVKEQAETTFESLKDTFAYTNKMQAPKITKVVVNVGTGKIDNNARVELIVDRLTKITGQQPSPRAARKSIANFKLREGQIVGYQMTLRGVQMESFLDKLINIALPRTRDFRGLSRDSVDEMGNYTVGIKEHTIFPEAADEELQNVFGFAITIVTTASTKEEAVALLEHYNFPLKKVDAVEV